MAQNSKVNTGAAAGDKLADVPASDAQAAPPDVPAQTTPLPAAVQGLAPAQPTVAVAPATPGTPAAPAGTPAAPAPPSSSPSKPRRTSSRRSNTATSATLAADDSDAELVRIHSELADLQTAVKKMTKAGDDERKNAKNIRSKLVQDVAALQGRIDSAPKVADVEPRLHTVEGQLETLAPLRDRVAELSDNLSYWRNDYTNFLSDTPQDREADSLTHRLSGLWSETEDLRKSLADMREELDQCFHELETTRVRERISERVRVLERAMIAAGTLNADGTIPYNDGYPRPRSRPRNDRSTRTMTMHGMDVP
ncbi:hypothetical protein EXIGLDRAFT_303235 [Exidia glandulosa HHB12029]|uniref:Uncharacterized protein n=1 Tax=Exidia glandulosa HHB12029 TaxID=1314781 RepID=A0A165LYF2_EXIGL|nr:hypothetical protein EXIGLDRAFT_303235 [Exidia glandulosa HHB12029]